MPFGRNKLYRSVPGTSPDSKKLNPSPMPEALPPASVVARDEESGTGSKHSRGLFQTSFRSRKSLVSLPRMVDRNLPFHQSLNKIGIRNTARRLLLPLVIQDWFHAVLRIPACWSVNFLLSLWVWMVGVFAWIYWYLDGNYYKIVDCGLGPTDGESISFIGAFAFSLETCTTVGYGLPGTSTSFFEKGCTAIQGTIFLQMMWSMMFNAFLLAFFYSLLSKSEFRSTQIIFTNKLLINVIDSNTSIEGNRAYVRIQCYDIDSAHPLVEAHARMYVLDYKLKLHPLRLMDPNDDLGGVLYPSVPADIVHHIDCHSPLFPRRLPFVEKSHGLVLRSIDSLTGNRDEIVCPVCGEAYGTYERLKKHIEYNAMVETKEGYPRGKSHAGLELPAMQPLTLDKVRGHIEKTLSEIIVVVEAIDPQLSGTFQSLQSYKYGDIVFGAEFAPCMSTNSEGTELTVDMQQFHKTCKKGEAPQNSVRRSESDESDEHSEDDAYIHARLAKEFSHLSDASMEDDDGGGAMSLENGGTYFRRDYDTFTSFQGTRGLMGNLFAGFERSTRAEEASETSLDRTVHWNERTSIHDRKPSYSSYS